MYHALFRVLWYTTYAVDANIGAHRLYIYRSILILELHQRYIYDLLDHVVLVFYLLDMSIHVYDTIQPIYCV